MSVGRSVLSHFAFFAFLGISRVGKFVSKHAPAQIITAPAQIITAPAQINTAPAQPPAIEQSCIGPCSCFNLCNNHVDQSTSYFSTKRARKMCLVADDRKFDVGYKAPLIFLIRSIFMGDLNIAQIVEKISYTNEKWSIVPEMFS